MTAEEFFKNKSMIIDKEDIKEFAKIKIKECIKFLFNNRKEIDKNYKIADDLVESYFGNEKYIL